MLVAIFHIWLGKVSGGVDVFFIVSGYLITSTLLFRLQRHGKINFLENFLGLAKRLFPLAFLVLLATVAMTILVLPQSVWTQAQEEFIASLFYFENWKLAFDSVDYLAENNVASPFQHFWALSIQGQFYITWPLLLTGVYLIAVKWLKLPFRKSLLGILSILFILSFSFSIYATNVNQPFTYFNTFARVWEFSLGGLLVLLLPYLKFKKPVHILMGWIGLFTILLTGILLPVADMFPGYAALLPTMGVIFIIIAAENGNSFGVERLLHSKPLQWMGSISYGVYLWHWPLLIGYLNVFAVEKVSLLDGLLIIIISIVLAYITIQTVEKPIRTLSLTKQKLKITSIVAASLVFMTSIGLAWMLYIDHLQAEAAKLAENTLDYPGGLVISDGMVEKEGIEPIPTLLDLPTDLPTFYSDPNCELGFSRTNGLGECSYGELIDPKATIALVGGSHSGHWFPAIEPILKQNSYRLDIIYEDACRFTTDDFDGALTESCMEWNEFVLEKLQSSPPDLVITTANVGDEDVVPQGYIEAWKELEGKTHILAIRDNPRTLVRPAACLLGKNEACEYPRSKVLSDEIPWENTANIPSNVTFADFSDYFCIEDTCPQVIGNVIVYRDLHHLSAAYAATLVNAVEPEIINAIKIAQQKNLPK